MSVRHAFNSPKADGGDATLVQPSNWNADHALDGVVGALDVLADGVGALTNDGAGNLSWEPAAPSGGTWTEVEVDFGSTPVYSKTFTVADGTVSGTSKVAVVPCGKIATGGSEDDWEWDAITFAANPGSGSFRVMASAFPGPVAGKRKISYQVA